MKLDELFKRTSSSWVRYSEYEYREAEDGTLYITPVSSAKVANIYNTLKNTQQMVLDALNAGMVQFRDKYSEDEKKKAVLDFVNSYGLMGFMTDLPTTPDFMDFETVYIPKNPIIEEDSMPVMDYVDLFFPFEELDITKRDRDTQWNITDKEMMALSMTMDGLPMAVNMAMHRYYSEPYEWISEQLKDWAFYFISVFLYYLETDDTNKELYRRGMNAFGALGPAYHIILAEERPTIVWDFHSLLRAVQMVIAYALTDPDMPLQLCSECDTIFIKDNPKAKYCSKACEEKAKKKDK